ncbi:MAG: CDP-alcohol phosphatidyltransferase family protein, partial [Candidatus Eisenbacteria bacterium]|nr:CDP-alcohol phosphatidyltransferase family protein [Candidatus Eisenbacteria bacterium]
MIGRLKTRSRKLIDPPARGLARIGVSPNVLTFAGLAFALVAGWILARGHLQLALIPLAASGLADMLDGAVARATGRSSPFGAALDSTIDRVADAAVFGGLLLGWLNDPPGGALLYVLLILVAMVASFLVSYVRARAEGLGFECQVGLMERPSRMVLLGLVFVIGEAALLPGLALVCVLTAATVVQRLAHVGRRARAA